jgi:hypothetical protein
MILISALLTYEEVQCRFEKEDYMLLSLKYINAKSDLIVLCPRGHEWVTDLSNFDSGRRCSVCSKKKKYSLQQVVLIFGREGYAIRDSIYINGKVPIKVLCSNGHKVEIWVVVQSSIP